MPMELIFSLIVAAMIVAAVAIWSYHRDAAVNKTTRHRVKLTASQMQSAEALAGGVDPAPAIPNVASRTQRAVLSNREAAKPAEPALRHSASSEKVQLTWIGPGQKISVGAITLDHPMTYVVDSRRSATHIEPAAIDLSIPVASNADQPTDRELPYWPTYAGLSPGQRRLYLNWLEAGR